MQKLKLSSLDRRFKKFEKPLRQTAEGVFKFMKKTGVGLDIYLVEARRMKFLNKLYRGKDSVTDVLAVEPPKGFPKEEASRIGEIYINPPCVKRKGYTNEYALIHGILHLLGFSHEGKSDNIEMRNLEREIADYLQRKLEL